MYNGDKHWDDVTEVVIRLLLTLMSLILDRSGSIDLAGRHQSMWSMNGRVWTWIGSSDSPLLLREWTRLRRPLCFQSRRFDIYCSWLLFKRTSHSSKMPGEGGAVLERGRFSPGSPRHNHGFHVWQNQQRPTGSWLVSHWPQREMKNSV